MNTEPVVPLLVLPLVVGSPVEPLDVPGTIVVLLDVAASLSLALGSPGGPAHPPSHASASTQPARANMSLEPCMKGQTLSLEHHRGPRSSKPTYIIFLNHNGR
jgi:hypothetical protein